MKKLFLICLATMVLAISTAAQGGFTTVSGAIVDPSGIPWTGGSISAQLVTPGGAAPTLNGVSFSGGSVSGLLGPGGTFTIRLGDNGVILPSGTQWKFTVNISPGVLPPLGTGPQSFTVTTPINCSTNTPATCTSNAMTITAALKPVPALTNILSSVDVITLTTTFQDAQNALPSTGGSSGIGGGTIDARNCTQLPASALDFGTFTQTKPLTILLGPCFYNFNRILLGNPGGNTIPFHMIGCGFICSVLVGTNTTVGQALITSATSNQTQYDVIFQDLAVFNSGTASQDVFGFTPTAPNSLNGFVFQRLFIGFGTFSGGVTGSAIKIDASALGHGNIERILIDDNHIELAGGLSAPAISLIGAIGKQTRILQNNFETGGATPSGVGISLTSASATAFPANVVIQSNTFDDAFLTTLEADGAVGVVFNGNIILGTLGGTRNGIQMQVGTGTVHSSLDASDNVFNVSGTLAYALKTTDASATASFTSNTIFGTPTTVFSGFTNNLIARNNTGGGLNISQWETVLFANLGTPANGSFVYCSDCTVANPCAGGGTGALAKRLNGVWVCN